MAKGQDKRREAKKPKASKKPAAGGVSLQPRPEERKAPLKTAAAPVTGKS